MGKSQSMLSNERQNSFLYDIIKVYGRPGILITEGGQEYERHRSSL